MKQIDIQQYIGNQAQLGGARHYTLSDGWGRNMRGIDVNSGNGLQYTILPDRGMDLSLASFRGTNLVYLTCNGETHPSFFEPENIGWLRTFAGGLLTTCGLTYFGSPVTDEGENLGLHGRYSNIPARQVADLSGWIGDEYHISIKGIVEEGHMFGNKLRLEREIETIQGNNSLIITDTVTNFGNKRSPYTILYHMNFGYPMLSEKADLVMDPAQTTPRDDFAASGINEFKSFVKPQPGYREQVFDHRMKDISGGETEVTLQNKTVGIALTLKFRIAQLPYLVQWKMMGQGEYVLGLEPCNVPGLNRKILKDQKKLPFLEPGEITRNRITIILNEIK